MQRGQECPITPPTLGSRFIGVCFSFSDSIVGTIVAVRKRPS